MRTGGNTCAVYFCDTINAGQRLSSTTAEMYVRGRDVEERKLILEFVDLRWHMLEEKSASEIEKEKIPEVLYKVADFIKQEGSWFGSASQLQAAINDASIPANQMAKQITRHYYQQLSSGICSAGYMSSTRDTLYTSISSSNKLKMYNADCP